MVSRNRKIKNIAFSTVLIGSLALGSVSYAYDFMSKGNKDGPQPMLSKSSLVAAAGANQQSDIRIYFKGTEIKFGGVKPINKNENTLVPFKKMFETLGFKVKWDAKARKVTGAKEGLTIEFALNSKTAKVNGKSVALAIPAQNINGNIMIPLKFLIDNSGYKATSAKANGVLTIKIQAGSGTQQQANDKAEPYVVKGYLLTKSGEPVAGASIFARNTQFYNSNIIGTTDDNGFYRIELPREGASYNMSADVNSTFNGKIFAFHLEADLNQAFSGKDGAVRNFTMKSLTGQIFVYSLVEWDLGRPDFKIEDLEVTLTPVGKLMDGSEGSTIVKRIGPVDGGLGIGDIPLGKYKASAIWYPEGHDPVTMDIRRNFIGTWGESAEFEFDKPRSTITSNYLSELEVRIPE
jgi:hypothetical protein